jgi:hypothetical protein
VHVQTWISLRPEARRFDLKRNRLRFGDGFDSSAGVTFTRIRTACHLYSVTRGNGAGGMDVTLHGMI